MSTPIETNTEGLQEILQTVYNLPVAGGGGSSKPDLVLTVSTEYFAPSAPEEFGAIDADEWSATLEKMDNGEIVNVVIKGFFTPDSGGPIPMCCPASAVSRRWNGMGLIFFVPPGASGDHSFCEIILVDGSVRSCYSYNMTVTRR